MASGRAGSDHIDTLFFFLIELAVFVSISSSCFKVKYRYFWIGVILGLAILTKWLTALIILPVWFIFIYELQILPLKKIFFRGFLIVFIAAIVVIPWHIYIHKNFPLEANWEQAYNTFHITTALEGHTGNFLFYFNKLRIMQGELIFIPILWFLFKTLKNLL